MKNIFRLMRLKHWLKNMLLFIPLAFSGNLFNVPLLLKVLYGFLAFSVLSSAVYILNDIRDVELDRQHEVKKNRPIAAGKVSIPAAYILAVALLSLTIIINGRLVKSDWPGFVLMLGYFIVNLGYSLGLKHIPFVDILLLVLGFLLRVLYGGAIIDQNVSSWVSLTVISLSFYLGLGKRRNELKKSGGQVKTRLVLKYYSFDFLDKFMYLCLSLAIVFYALWSADEAVIARLSNKLIWTVPLVILLMMKYSADVEADSYGDPVDVILNDKSLLIIAGGYAAMMLLLIYVPGI